MTGLLLKTLSGFLKESLSRYGAAQGEDKEFRPPQVLDWDLPYKNPKSERTDYPCVIPRVSKGQDGANQGSRGKESIVHVTIFFGVYSEPIEVDGAKHNSGGYDLINLMDHVRFALLQLGMLDDRYMLRGPLEWEIPEEQPEPYWIGKMHTTWSTPTIHQAPSKYIFNH